MRRAVRHLAWLLVIAACNSSNPSSKPPGGGTAPPNSPAAKLRKLPPDPREPMLARGVAYLLEKQHLRQRPIDDALSREVFAEYLDRIDPAKLFLLQSHVDLLREYETRIDDQLRDADLELARAGAALLADRWALVARLIADELSRPFDYTVVEDYESDPDKLAFARTEQELADRWRKQLKIEMLERLERAVIRAEVRAEGKPDATLDPTATEEAEAEPPPKDKGIDDLSLPFAEREKKAREALAASWSGRFSRLARSNPLQPAETLLNALASVYDPHTLYMPPVDKENFDIAVSGTLEGIGAVLGEDDHYVVVREIVAGGASWKHGGLEVGDLILAVAQAGGPFVDITDMPLDEAVQMIRGPKGTVVRLTIKKPDERVLTISITRDRVVVEDAYARGALVDLGPDTPAMGYIHLPSFYGDISPTHKGGRTATGDVRALLASFRGRKLGGVIIDVRGNGGGLLDQAGGITGLLIDKGPVVQTRYFDGQQEVVEDEEAGVTFDQPVVVMTDRFTASAGEILADALQDYRRAVVVGTPTHGKGTVQAIIDLDRLRAGDDGPPLGVLKLTLSQFFGVDGNSTQVRGVTPDVLLPDPMGHVEAGEKFLDHPIPWSKVAALAYIPWDRASWRTDQLALKSGERQHKQAVFGVVAKRSAYLDARRKQSLVPLQREAFQTHRKRQRDELKALSPRLDQGPARLEVTPLDASGREATGEAAKRLDSWRKGLGRDPWLEEALRVLHDMAPRS